ncbi:glycosyltransferase [Halalkalibacter krulwichiae]|uniref:Glycosyl transferases group 1 n=2 Tax=Halalkalibacter krulwichiae TaxID=199441 RepID=A0A1X9MDT5_9BACI|nr:glycosyltransferase [Halalkalibacter krulwichiae]ARK29711.1 Glycosyl transferases group 1 [Halalkalibacter krulwichiae]
MACGVPVVAPHHSAIPEIVDRKTGYLYEEENSKDAIKGISSILDDTTSYLTKSYSAREKVTEQFSISICGDYYAELIQTIVKEANE